MGVGLVQQTLTEHQNPYRSVEKLKERTFRPMVTNEKSFRFRMFFRLNFLPVCLHSGSFLTTEVP